MGRVIAALLVMTVLLPLACAHPPRDGSPSESSLDRIRARGVIRVGVSEFEPWAMRDKRGKPIGFEIDVAAALAEDMGVGLESVVLPFERLVPELRAGNIDLIAAGLSITPSRALEVAYSAPYRYSEITILASRERAGGRSGLAQFDGPETTIVAIRGTTGDMTARWALASAKLTLVRDQAEALAAVLEGRAHAAVATDPFPRLESMRNPEKLYLPLGIPLARTAEAFAVRRGDRDLLGWLNSWIVSRRTSRWLERRQTYWFHSLMWESRVYLNRRTVFAGPRRPGSAHLPPHRPTGVALRDRRSPEPAGKRTHRTATTMPRRKLTVFRVEVGHPMQLQLPGGVP